MRFRDIPKYARAYILYHTIISPFLVSWYLLPLYMMLLGYSVLELGVFFTMVNALSIPLTYMVGKLFDELPIRDGLICIDLLEGASYLCYAMAEGGLSPIMLTLGCLLSKIAGLFYPLYQACEQILYPEEIREEIFVWHLRLPEISQIVGFLAFGYILSYIWPDLKYYRVTFIVFSIVSFAMVPYLISSLPRIDRRERLNIGGIRAKLYSKGFRMVVLIEALYILAFCLMPEFVLLNYVIFTLNKKLFHVMLIESSMSISTIIATYIAEKLPKKYSFRNIALGISMLAAQTLIMAMSPPFLIVLATYFIGRLGDSIAFPFYRSWIFSNIPYDRVSEFHAALSSIRKTVALISPAIAGLLASIHATLPYALSFILFLTITITFLPMPISRKNTE